MTEKYIADKQVPTEISLEEKVRWLIGEGGPQLPIDEYEARIDAELRHMKPADLLRFVSMALDP